MKPVQPLKRWPGGELGQRARMSLDLEGGDTPAGAIAGELAAAAERDEFWAKIVAPGHCRRVRVDMLVMDEGPP